MFRRAVQGGTPRRLLLAALTLLFVGAVIPASGSAAPTISNVTVLNPYNGDWRSAEWCATVSDPIGTDVVHMSTDGSNYNWQNNPPGSFEYCFVHRYPSSGRFSLTVLTFSRDSVVPLTQKYYLDVREFIQLYPPRITSVKTSRLGVAKIRFTGNRSEVSYQCRIDGGRFRYCSSPKTYFLKPGRHVFRVRTLSPDGSVKTSANSRSFRVPKRRG
mgnify:CR=1 FL=1